MFNLKSVEVMKFIMQSNESYNYNALIYVLLGQWWCYRGFVKVVILWGCPKMGYISIVIECLIFVTISNQLEIVEPFLRVDNEGNEFWNESMPLPVVWGSVFTVQVAVFIFTLKEIWLLFFNA